MMRKLLFILATISVATSCSTKSTTPESEDFMCPCCEVDLVDSISIEDSVYTITSENEL